MVCHEGGLKKKKKKTYVKLQRSEITPSFLPDFRVPQVKKTLLTSPSMYFSRQMAQSEVELLLSESEAPQLLSRCPLPLALNFLVSIFSRAWMAILFIELCGEEGVAQCQRG